MVHKDDSCSHAPCDNGRLHVPCDIRRASEELLRTMVQQLTLEEMIELLQETKRRMEQHLERFPDDHITLRAIDTVKNVIANLEQYPKD